MDLRRGYGTITLVTRWLLVLLFAALASTSTAREADAQAFKPKRSTPVKGAPAKKTPTSAKKTPAAAPRRVVTSSKAPSKKRTSRAAETSGRTDDLTPDSDAPRGKSTTKDDDYVLIEDDDE